MPLFAGDRDAGLTVDGFKLTDHGRAPISINYERIEDRRRMANGRLRIKHVANKTRVSTSWDGIPNLDSRTVDGNVGAGRMKEIYETKPATPITVIVTYRDQANGSQTTETMTMVFASFDYEVVHRSPAGFDIVNVSMELEEV